MQSGDHSRTGSVRTGSRANSSLLEREEEYKRLNAELEARTVDLVREAEAIMTEQEQFLMDSLKRESSYSNNGSSEHSENDSERIESKDIQDFPPENLIGLLSLVDDNEYTADGTVDDNRSHSARVPSTFIKKPTAANSWNRPKTGQLKNRRKVTKKPTSAAAQAADDVAIPTDFMSGLKLDKAISDIETNLKNGVPMNDDDIMPDVAAEMGVEAQIRFLKAKLRVLQEEVDRLSNESRSGIEQRKKLSQSLKTATEEQARLKKINNTQHVQLEKQKKLYEEEKKKSEALGQQVQTLRKEVDSLTREQKQSSVSHKAVDVRLNRALEDVERYKSLLQKERQAAKEPSTVRAEMDQLRTENKRLERIKTEMTSVYKCQQKLIGILKRQILHLEAAKLLSFTEEEFVKMLDWGSK